MRLTLGVRALAAAAVVAAATAPSAHASIPSDSGGYSVTDTPISDIAAGHRDPDSPDAALIAIGAGAAVVITAGAGASRTRHRRRTPTPK